MNILKETGNRLKRTALVSLSIAVIFLVALFLLGLTTDPRLPMAVNWAEFTNLYAAAIFVLAYVSIEFFRKYRNYMRGIKGENRVVHYLNSNFGEEYFLINDLVYENDKGHKENIDHIVLSPNGIFVLETKDYRGKISCNGSFWTVPFPYGRSPSKQARGNAFWLQKKITDLGIIQNVNLWVQPIVVFSNPNIELEAIHPEAEVVKLDDLAELINAFNKLERYNFSNSQLKAIGDTIVQTSLPIARAPVPFASISK